MNLEADLALMFNPEKKMDLTIEIATPENPHKPGNSKDGYVRRLSIRGGVSAADSELKLNLEADSALMLNPETKTDFAIEIFTPENPQNPRDN